MVPDVLLDRRVVNIAGAVRAGHTGSPSYSLPADPFEQAFVRAGMRWSLPELVTSPGTKHIGRKGSIGEVAEKNGGLGRD